LDGDTYQVKFNLFEDYTCEVISHTHPTSTVVSDCNWTMMYDQALVIALDWADHGDDFIANFRYEVRPNQES